MVQSALAFVRGPFREDGRVPATEEQGRESVDLDAMREELRGYRAEIAWQQARHPRRHE